MGGPRLLDAVPLTNTSSFSLPRAAQYYSTERMVEWRRRRHNGGSHIDTHQASPPRHLYRSELERENCGVGLIASLKSQPSRSIVERADEMLVRMSHRGGTGVDPASGDGSGESVCV